MKMVALIPARAGSKRCPGKNTRLLAGHPLIAYTITAAQESGVFSEVIVSTEDWGVTMTILESCGNCRVVKRSEAAAEDDAPDIMWVRELFDTTFKDDKPNAFAILRPTSPFRTADTIQRAHKQFFREEIHSLRAMQPVKEHPGKMWHVAHAGYPAVPLIGHTWPPEGPGFVGMTTRDDRPWHSLPTQTLPKVYIQNASLEMAWSYVIPAFGTISGRKVAPFFTQGNEGFDINTEADFAEAERMMATSYTTLKALHAHR